MMNNNSNLELANSRSRAFAFMIDDLIVTLILFIAFWDKIVSAVNTSNPENVAYLIQVELLMPLIFLKIIYQTFFVWYYGATIGKFVTKIRVIDVNNFGRVSLLSSFLRAGGRIISEMFFYLGFAIAFFTEGKRTFHDYSGRTLVVNA
ncbi:MAG: RDD family protein [Arcobacter sp.]|nr:MAG: RDD family protein [Arcobacter sp.]